ncbi:dihydrofolate reductase family protein [Bernardetia sp. OM2101]|uniref:dihydrofolate reductase family protein n=1 Tax=Bernardetia sp. OM2101 TaxID=3344876 RepID=UPI0035CF6C35
MKTSRKVILFISMSLDGFIATKEDDISWLSMVEKEGEDYGYDELQSKVDTYIVGSNTYQTILKLTNGIFPQAEMYDCYVITRQEITNEGRITFYNGDIEKLIQKLKKEDGKDIYCDGGGQIVKLLQEKNLIDEYVISIIPILLGDGKRLFIGDIEKRISLKLEEAKSFDTGLVQIRYRKK